MFHHLPKASESKTIVLVVDDSPATRRLFRRALEDKNVAVVEAPDGPTALKLLSAIPRIDLALVDFYMPLMDGVELVKKIRAHHQHGEIKILMVTAESSIQNMTEAIAAGASDYLVKPFTKSLLFEKIDSLGISLG